MNYRHAFHAGNFADVFKHAVLALILDYLCKKPAPWRFIDTHAGVGRYDLSGEAPQRTGEWRHGIGRIAHALGLMTTAEASSASPSPAALKALEPYARALHAANGDARLLHYPGSSFVARALARKQDRLMLTELHEADAAALARAFAGDQQVKVRALDGWLGLGAFVPPKERRGLVLVDPPFEEAGDYDRLISGVANAHRRWPTGSYLLWHPIKNTRAAQRYEDGLRQTGIAKILIATLLIRRPTNESFDGCGLAIVNPPFTLQGSLEALLPYLWAALAQGPGASFRLDRIGCE